MNRAVVHRNLAVGAMIWRPFADPSVMARHCLGQPITSLPSEAELAVELGVAERGEKMIVSRAIRVKIPGYSLVTHVINTNSSKGGLVLYTPVSEWHPVRELSTYGLVGLYVTSLGNGFLTTTPVYRRDADSILTRMWNSRQITLRAPEGELETFWLDDSLLR